MIYKIIKKIPNIIIYPKELKTKDYLQKFKHDNPHVRHSSQYFTKLLKILDYHKIHTERRNMWQKS